MNKKNISIIVVVALVAIVGLFFLTTYNSLVKKEEACSQQWSKVESQYQRRMDLIPNLVSTVKGYAKHEEETLLKVIEARNNATQVKIDANNATQEQMAQFQQSQDALSSALKGLNVVIERYPDLKANQNFLQLQSEIADVENKLAAVRRFFNSTTRELNNAVQTFPSNIFAKMFGFSKEPMFEVPKEERAAYDKAPEINF